MRKLLIPIILIVVAIFAYGWAKGFYNKAIELKNDAEMQWANVESAYQRRADLIPNLVETVKGYASHEKETLQAVIEARAKATQMTVDPANITPDQMAQFQQAQQGLSGALNRLMVVVEKYPELKADKNFLELQSQLESTENRINVERNRFNESVRPYTVYIEKFPNNLFAGLFGLKPIDYYKAEPGSEKAPKVDFNN